MQIEARGLEGQMFFDGHNVTITRRGLFPFLTSGSGGTKTISLRSISAVQHRRCGLFNGFLQLSVAGELDRSNSGRTGSMSQDENAVIFYFKANRAFQEFADVLRQAVSDLASGVTPVTAPVQAQSVPAAPVAFHVDPVVAPRVQTRSIFVQIEELGQLRDAGLITVDEFETKKREMLARL